MTHLRLPARSVFRGLLLAIPFPLLALAACAGDESTSAPPEPPADPAVVGSTGGSVSAANGGAGISVPSGALASPVRITVTSEPALAAANPMVGSAFLFEPSGTQFAVPATMKIRFDEDAFRPGTDLSRVRLARLENGRWVPRGEDVQVNPATREVQGRVSGFSRWAAWVDPCTPRSLQPLAGTRSETLAVDDCRFESGSVVRRSQYFRFTLAETTPFSMTWSSGMDFVVGLKEDTEDPALGTVWGSAAGTEANGRQAAFGAILPAGSYQLFFSGADSTQLGPYTLATASRTVAQATSGLGCTGYNLLVPGTTVSGLKLSAAEGDCRTTVRFNPDPQWIGRPLVLENHLVRLLPGQSYQVRAELPPGSWNSALTVYSGGQVRAQQFSAGSRSTLSVDLTPPALAHYQIEVSVSPPLGQNEVPEMGYSLSVSGGSAPVPASVEISSGPVELTVPGDTVHALARVTQGGTLLSGAQVRWESSDVAVARVGVDGVVTAVAHGSATLRATWGAGSGTAQITVDTTKLALRGPTGPVAAGLVNATLRAGSLAGDTRVRIGGTDIPSEVQGERTLRFFLPPGDGGDVTVSVARSAGGVTRTGQFIVRRQAAPTVANPATFLSDADRQRREALSALGQLGTPPGMTDAQAAALRTTADRWADSINVMVGGMDAEGRSMLAWLLAGVDGFGSAGVPAAGPSLATLEQCQVRRAAAVECMEAMSAHLLRNTKEFIAWIAVLGAGALLLKAATVTGFISGALFGSVGAVVALTGAFFAIQVGKDSAHTLSNLWSPAVAYSLGLEDSFVQVQQVGGGGGPASTAPIVFRSGEPRVLPLVVGTRTPTEADRSVPFVASLFDAKKEFDAAFSSLAAKLPDGVDVPAPAFPAGRERTLSTPATPAEIRVVSVGRAGVSGAIVDVGGQVGLRLTGPSSGSESFPVTLMAEAGKFGQPGTTLQVRLESGTPNILNAWVQRWTSVGQNAACNANFPQGTNGDARIRIQLSEPLPAFRGFHMVTYWNGGAGGGWVPASAATEVGERLYEIGFGFCWGGPTGNLEVSLQFEGPDGTRTNIFRFLVPRP